MAGSKNSFTRESGYLEPQGSGAAAYKAFVPKPLPPDPPLVFSPSDYDLSERANRALGRLDAVHAILPDTTLFLYVYVRKEAVLSSQIEGTQSSLSDLLVFESDGAPGVPIDDVAEVSRYVAALTYGLKRLRDLPLSLRLLQEIHAVLMEGARGGEKTPGEFRRSQNWVGGSRPGNATYVPPPPHQVVKCMGELETFLHDRPSTTPTLLKAALAHVQFETIHPFQDGNGRLGRLLITLLLCAEGALQEPLLYLSLYFKEHREAYYEHLQRVRTHGDWEAWVRFFLRGVESTASSAVTLAQTSLALFQRDHDLIAKKLGRKAPTGLQVHAFLKQKPIFKIPDVVAETSLTFPTVSDRITDLMRLKLVAPLKERSGSARMFVYEPYFALLAAG